MDAYLSGRITRHTTDEVCFDVWLSNAESHEVLCAKSACSPLSVSSGQSASALRPEGTGWLAAPPAASGATPSAPTVKKDVSRDSIRLLAEEIARSIKQIGSGSVTSVSGKLVYGNKGKDSDVMPGMVAYLVATGDTTRDAAAHSNVQV